MNILKNRKVLGTILGTILFISCLMYFTYAYYVWKSDNSEFSFSITDNASKSTCYIGPDVNVDNIGPVLDYRDGVKAVFNIANDSDSDSIISVVLNINSISDSLRDETFKYKLIKGSTVIAEGNFKDFVVDSEENTSGNVIANNISIEVGENYDFQFIVYIDGNVYNNPEMQTGSMISSLSVGDCNVAVNHFVEDILKPTAISDKSIDFSQSSSDSGTNGIYLRSGTENDKYPIYYYRGNVDNNLIFADVCWKVVRSTETGGLKLIYNGLPTYDEQLERDTCNNTGTSSQISTKKFNESSGSQESLAYVGYMYSSPYVSLEKDMYGITDAYVYGNDVVYADGEYTLKDTITSSDWASLDAGGLSNYHYTCFSTGTTCSEVSYIYNTYNYTDVSLAYAWYINLTGGKKVDDALEEMLGVNDYTSNYNNISSTIKGDNVTEGTLDYWYYVNIEQKEYGKYVEDTVWCNDRSRYSIGGFNSDGGATDVTNISSSGFVFSVYGRSLQSSPLLSCNRKIDKFTVSEAYGNGNLTYPVGLLTADETMLAGGGFQTENNSYYLYTGQNYWTGSAAAFYKYNAYITFINANGGIDFNFATSEIGVRPSISLKPGFVVKDGGDGSVTNPYVVS